MSAPSFMKGKALTDYLNHTLILCLTAVASGLFDIIGHCDLIRIYGYKPSSDLEPLVQEACQNNENP